MAILFQQNAHGVWQSRLLEDSVCTLVAHAADAPSAPTLRRCQTATGERWVLLGSRDSHVSHNGAPLALNLAVLNDRDEIRVVDAATGQRRRFYFSTERLAVVETLPESLTVVCPRCKEAITSESLAVRCPGCGVWHHELPTRKCWSYAESCASCSAQETALDGRLRWSPEEL